MPIFGFSQCKGLSDFRFSCLSCLRDINLIQLSSLGNQRLKKGHLNKGYWRIQSRYSREIKWIKWYIFAWNSNRSFRSKIIWFLMKRFSTQVDKHVSVLFRLTWLLPHRLIESALKRRNCVGFFLCNFGIRMFRSRKLHKAKLKSQIQLNLI